LVTLAQDTAYRLLDKDKVDILAGVVDSGSAYAVAKLVVEHGKPFVIANAGADDLTQRQSSPLILRTSFSNSAGSHPLGEWAYEQGYRKAVAMGADNAAGHEQVGGMCKTFTKLGGKIVQEIWTPLGTQNFRHLLEKINPEADVVMVFFAGGDAMRFVEQYAESGLKRKIPVVAKGFLVDENILSKVGDAADGIVTESHWSYMVDTPENDRFKAAYTAKYGRRPTLYSEQGYVTGMVIAEALNKTKGVVRGPEFVQAMRSLELKAPRGTVTFDQYGAPIQTYYIRKVQVVDGDHQNAIVRAYPSVSQFWNWPAREFMSMTPYRDMKGKW
ncbi:MAG: ABC transporter substrate-binding protein, partial [Pseudomonadota bacterium]